jgi:ubiquinone/menaquinone biosynthesis C-methylase UbiE
MVHHIVCPLCASEMIDLQFRCNDHYVSKQDFAVFKCSKCGFSFTQDYPEETEIAFYYESDDYISHSDTSKGLYNKLYHIARDIMMLKKKNLIIKNTRLNKGTILDIGSGTGFFAATMKRSGWRVRGVEINEKARKFSISHFELEIGTPDDMKTFEANSFDCITLWHVLEHFHDPFWYTSEINRLLKPGAICVVALPNCSSYDARHYKQFWAALDVPRHLWHFNPSSFKLLSEKTGLILEDLRVLSLDVFYISLLSEKYKGSSLPFLAGMLKATVFAFLSVFNKRKSSSVIYILRKSVD